MAKVAKEGRRYCTKCGSINGSIFPVCNPCRQGACNHKGDTHYDGSLALICQCGKVLSPRKIGFGIKKNVRGVFPFQVPLPSNHAAKLED